MRPTECYSFFEIRSDGYLDFDKGYISSPNSDFNPKYITEILKIEPHKIVTMGNIRESGTGKYPFTKWIFQPKPEADDPTQCLSIVKALKVKIPLLQKIHNELNVNFSIQVCADIVGGKTVPCFGFSEEIIEFCFLTHTDIGLYINISEKE